MLRSMAQRGQTPDVVHIHSAPNAQGVIFHDELQELHQGPSDYELRLHLTDDSGHLEFETELDTLVPDWKERPTWACGPPSMLDAETLAELPIPLQFVLATALLPYEVAITYVKIMKNTEALLGEMVFHMNALRPAVSSISQAFADGQFNQVFRTIDQIQQGTNAFALVWAPLTAVRDRFVPGATVTVPPPPPPAPRPYRPRQSPPMAITPPPAPVPPTTAEYLGRLGGRAWDQAASLPGATR